MKKSISIILAMMMTISVIAPCQSVIAVEVEKRDTIRFFNLVSSLNDEYNSDSEIPVASETKDNENGNLNYTENRLIIKTKKEIKHTDAVDSVYGLDYAILQYEDKGTMLEEYEELTDKGYLVEKDKRFFVNANDTTALAEEATDMWAYDSIGVDYAKSNANSNKEIVVGVFDTGVDYTHEDLAERITDTTINLSYTGEKDNCMDDQGHGTAVASIIAQSTPDNVKIKPYKVFDSDGYATLSEVIAALEYVLAENDKPDIMNMSVGGYNFDGTSSIETELVSKLIDQGVTVCIASGNDNIPIKYTAPADCDTAITVGAYDNTNHICTFSNYGEEVDIAAPGYKVNVIDLWTGKYTTNFSGTSAATPFASSACAYILMQDNKLSPAKVKEKLENSAIYMGEDEELYYGCGMLNLPNLIENKTENVPTPNIEGGLYHDTQTVEFNNIPSDTQLVYTLDKSIPSSTNGTVYTEPITIDNEMQLNYALIKDDKYISSISSQYYTVQYYLDGSEFEISKNGEITAYNSDKNNIVVPDTIDGIVPTSVGKKVFSDSNLTSIVLPDSVEDLWNGAFRDSIDLKHITARGVIGADTNAFRDCISLQDEVMPILEELGGYTFYNCIKLHSIDFDEKLNDFGSYAFQYSGLIEVNLTNFENRLGAMSAFQGSALMYCNAPMLLKTSQYFFADCYFLQELNAPNLIQMDNRSIRDCYYLTEFETPNVETFYHGALAYSHIDTLFAPKCTSIERGYNEMGLGQFAEIRVVNMPALDLANNLAYNAFYDMFIEELYLPSVTRMRDLSLTNLPNLKILYMPKVKTFYWPDVNGLGMFPESGPLEIVWVPSATSINNGWMPATTKLLYAPNTTNLVAAATDATIVVSEKLTDLTLWFPDGTTEESVFPTIIAPKGSYTEEVIINHPNWNIDFIDSDSIAQCLGGEIRTKDSGLRFGFTLDESILDFDYKTYAQNIEYGFVYTYNEVSDNTNTASSQLRTGADGAKNRKADRRDVNGDISHYNIVFTNIPSDHYNDLVSARAYVCIDGMYFYSDVTTRSYSSVANAILNDDEMSQAIKDDVLASLYKES